MRKNYRLRVLVLGNYGYANHDLNGQTIKTRVTRELLENHLHNCYVDYFDTQTLKKISSIYILFSKICRANYIFYLPAHNNLKYFFPILFLLSKIFRFKILYSVIGGWLVPYLKNKPMHRWMLKRITVILAETKKMKDELELKYGFSNVDVLYNFRFIKFTPKIIINDSLRLIFMARVDPNKGLDTIFNFCDYISHLHPLPNITVDIYGPLTPQLNQEKFFSIINEYSFVKYQGELEPKEINAIISSYDIMMLPTHYYTEGLPGTIIDTFTSGLTTIVSDWKHAREFVDNGKSGIIIPFENHQNAFNNAIMNLYYNRDYLIHLKKGAIEAGKKFTQEDAWNIVKQHIK